MISNAQAEHNAMNSRNADGRVIATTERSDYGRHDKRMALPLSDGEGSAYDEEEAIKQRQAGSRKRGSI